MLSSTLPYQVPFLPQAFNTFDISFTLIYMSDSSIVLASNFESDSCPVLRTGVSLGSNHSPFVYDRLGHKVIPITNYSYLERLLEGSQDEGASSRDFSFVALVFYDGVEGDHMTASTPSLFGVAGTLSSHTMPVLEMQVARLRREHTMDCIYIYQRTYNLDPNISDIKAHLECKVRSMGVS